jgi:hypothetical protein
MKTLKAALMATTFAAIAGLTVPAAADRPSISFVAHRSASANGITASTIATSAAAAGATPSMVGTALGLFNLAQAHGTTSTN